MAILSFMIQAAGVIKCFSLLDRLVSFEENVVKTEPGGDFLKLFLLATDAPDKNSLSV
jgi:hypothetical protein